MKRRILLACALIAGLPLVALANLPIYKIADFNTVAPDGGTFTSFGLPTAILRETPFWQEPVQPFAFSAMTSNGTSGVYYYTLSDDSSTVLQSGTIADSTMTVPQGGATFTGFSLVSSGFGETGFVATDSSGGQGIYTQSKYGLNLIATSNTVGSDGVPLGQFRSLSVMSGGFAEIGGSFTTDHGVYSFDALGPDDALELFTGATTSTTPPGASGPFTSFGPTSFKAQQQGMATGLQSLVGAFRATAGGVEGIYADPPGSSSETLATVGSIAPDVNGNPTSATFTSFGNPVATSNEVAFTAHYSDASGDHQGIFAFGPYYYLSTGLYPNPSLKEMVATGDVAPDSGGATFAGFFDLASDGAYKPFVASLSNGRRGIYQCYSYDVVTPEVIDYKVLETGDILDGKVVADFDLSPESCSDGYTGAYAFQVDFTDGSQGVYYFAIPEPGYLEFLFLPLLLVLRNRRRAHSVPNRRSVTEPLEARRLLSLPPTTPIGLDIASYVAPDGKAVYVTTSTDALTDAAELNSGVINDAISDVAASSNGTSGGVIYFPEFNGEPNKGT